jgi:hypothetical protein
VVAVAMTLYFSVLVVPALVDCVVDDPDILWNDASNEEDSHVVFDRDKFGVVYSGFDGKLLSWEVELNADGAKAEIGFIPEHGRPAPQSIDNSVLVRFDSPLGAGSAFVRQNGPFIALAGVSKFRSRADSYTQVQCPSSFATTMKRRTPT